jgi:hypothetical protein
MPLSLIALVALAGSVATADTTAENIVRMMHDRYDGKWPTEVTFVQASTFLTGDSSHVETWYEATGSPSKLRIDFAPIDSGNAIIFRNDSIYQFKSDSLVAAVAEIHPLMVLSRDVYVLPVERTMEKLRTLGFDLSKVHEETWQGRPAYVVGADPGEIKAKQFWVDKENLLFVRMREPFQQDPKKMQEVQFNKYRQLGDGWIETEVVVLIDGRPVFTETYDQIREAPELTEELFDPRSWGRPGWVKEKS